MPFNLENKGYIKKQGIYVTSEVQFDFMYSDGDQVENYLSECIRKSEDVSVGSEELQKYIRDWPSLYHLSPKRADLLRPFADQLKNKKVLEIGSGCGAVTRYLGELGCSVLSVEGSLRRARITAERCRGLEENVTVVNDNFKNFKCDEKFEFVILVGVLEYGNLFMGIDGNGPAAMLKSVKELLNPAGNIIIAIENKIGLKYWAGAPEDHVNEAYYNIQDLYTDKSVETFGRFELTALLKQSGFSISDFMYPFPDYKFADVIITDAGLKKQGFNPVDLLLEKFDYFQSVKYESRFDSNLAAYALFNNQLLSHFANSFLVLATTSDSSQQENQTLAYVHSTHRKKRYAKQTTFLSDPNSEIVLVHRQLLYGNNESDSPALQHAVQDEEYINGKILMTTILPIVSANGWSMKDIVNWARTFYEVIISESHDKENQPWLEGKYLDLTPFNIILVNGRPHFFDLEWISNENVPAYYVFLRGLCHTFWRILFVNNPKPGTPLQVVQLAREVTKYYFRFDEAEFSDCKSREMKYFSAVGPIDMTDPFPPLELNVRNSDSLALIETNTQLSIQNENLSNELNKSKHESNSKIIALLEEAKQRELQFNHEARQRNEQFDHEKNLLLEEHKQKEAHFDNQQANLLDEIRKKKEQLDELRQKEAQLLREVNVYKKNIQWYADTYENRSIAGVLKTKIASLFKKKIIHDDEHHISVVKNFPKKNYQYYLNPGNGIILSEIGKYIVTDTDPFFWVDFRNRRMHRGWYWLQIEVTEEEGVLLSPKLYFDYGNGFNEKDVWNLPRPIHGKIRCLVHFQVNIIRLRFDPSTGKCAFSINGFYLKPISAVKAFQIAVSRQNSKSSQFAGYFFTFKELSNTLIKTGLIGVRNRVLNIVGLRGEKIAEKYNDWCALYDTISVQQFNTIRSLSDNLSYQPLLSVVMPVFNAPIHYLQRAIESVENQAYKNWELCIADDKSSNKKVIKLLKKYALKDNRIKIAFRDVNGHISEASNSALKLVSGDYIVLMDQDDELRPHSLYMVAKTIEQNRNLELIYSDEDKIDEQGYRFDPYFKTDWNKELFYGQNMISHLGVYKKSLIDKVSGFRKGYEGSQDYDLALRCLEFLQPEQIHHIPHILYHWRAIAGSTAVNVSNKNYAYEAGLMALNDHLQRTAQQAKAEKNINNSYRVKWELPDPIPKVSIIIPTKNNVQILSTCLDSIVKKTKYPSYEILIIDNDSDEPSAIEYLENISRENSCIKVYSYTQSFNFSAIINYGVKLSSGDVVLLLNNDTEVINNDWLTEMASQCLREEIGAVGAKLYYPNGKIQHAGVFLYDGHPGNHIYLGRDRDDQGYFNKLNLVQCYSAVTAACLAVRKNLFMKVGGFDEVNLKVAYNDVDFCLKIRELGYKNLWTPFAELIHHESLSRGNDLDEINFKRFKREHSYMLQKWSKVIPNDPYFNPNLGHDTRVNQFAFPPRSQYEWQDSKNETQPI